MIPRTFQRIQKKAQQKRDNLELVKDGIFETCTLFSQVVKSKGWTKVNKELEEKVQSFIENHPNVPLCRISTRNPVENNFKYLYFWSRRETQPLDHIERQLVDTRDSVRYVNFIRYVILICLSKQIPDQNNFTNKIHGYFVTINWDFYFKIIYIDIEF